MQEDQKRKQRENQQNYGQELESEVFNKLKKNKDSENAQKNLEMQLALQKKAEHDNIQMSNLDRKKQMQKTLADDYERTMRMKKDRNNYEKVTDLHNGMAANQKALNELDYLKQGEQEKRKMIKELLSNDKLMHDGQKFQQYRDQSNGLEEAKKLFEEREKREQMREQSFSSRYSKFNEFQNKVAQSYSEQVLYPTMEKDMKFNQVLRKQEQEAKKKAEQDALIKSKVKQDWAKDTRVGLEKQMKIRNDGGQAVVALHQYEEGTTKAIERDLTNLDMIEKTEKKVRQQKYKEMLDNQAKTRQNMKMYGNMTGIEKQFNKNDLSAFKNYDNKTYALIPGLNSVSYSPSKKVAEDKATKQVGRSFEEMDHRMNQFGLTRDVTLVKNPALYANAHRSSVDDITGHVAKKATTQRADDVKYRTSNTSPANKSSPKMPFGQESANINSINNFNNHHLYQSYNPISGGKT